MKKIIALIFLVFLLSTCNDGDVITVEFNFDDSFETCGETELVLFKVKNDPAESLFIFISNLTPEELTVFDEDLGDVTTTLVFDRTLNATTNTFVYRRYNGEITGSELFCNVIPPNIDITSDDQSLEGQVTIETVVIEEDNDGIPWQDEDENLDDDNNPATNPTDTDNDGIPNYMDVDDDGDNVLTKDEDENIDADDNPFTNPLDTDDDGIFDYLDTDDDDDGTLTRDEESLIADNNPINDVTDNNFGSDYLNPNVNASVAATSFRSHTVVRNYTITVLLENIQLSNLTQDGFDFGRREQTETITLTPIFN